jgi:hypothetical protein
MRAGRSLPSLALVVVLSGCAVVGVEGAGRELCPDANSPCSVRADQLRDVEQITVDAGSSCGLKYRAVEYQGAEWMFDPANPDEAHPGWASDGLVIQVGRFGAGVWAVAPDGSSYRLKRVEEASLLYCLW